MNLSKAYVTLSGCVHEFIYHWNCLSVLHSSIFRTANFYWRHLRLLCLPVLFGHLETFSKWSKSLKTCLIRTTSALDSYVLVCVSAWYICISPLTNYNVCRRNIKQTHTSLCFTINFYWLEDRWNTKKKFYIVLSELQLLQKTLRQTNFINYRRRAMTPT